MNHEAQQLEFLMRRIARGDSMTLVEVSALVTLLAGRPRVRDGVLSALVGRLDVALAIAAGEAPSMAWVMEGPIACAQLESAQDTLARWQIVADADPAAASTVLAMRALVGWMSGRVTWALGLLDASPAEVSLGRLVRRLIRVGGEGPRLR